MQPYETPVVHESHRQAIIVSPRPTCLKLVDMTPLGHGSTLSQHPVTPLDPTISSPRSHTHTHHPTAGDDAVRDAHVHSGTSVRVQRQRREWEGGCQRERGEGERDGLGRNRQRSLIALYDASQHLHDDDLSYKWGELGGGEEERERQRERRREALPPPSAFTSIFLKSVNRRTTRTSLCVSTPNY